MMGKCRLSFDQIELVNKKSDTRHSDNDWMVVSWFVGDKTVRTDKFPLYNQNGSTVLDSGDAIVPFVSEVDCHDNEAAIAAVQVVNLGSFDPSDQVKAVGDLAESLAQFSAKVYLKEVELYLKYSGYVPGAPSLPGPLSDILASAVSDITPSIVQAIGTLFEDVIIPLLDDLIGELQVLLGKPNCNGDVLHDVFIFGPDDPIPAVSIDKVYEAAHSTGCGSAARTRVHVTQSRDLDPQMQFSNTPAPSVTVAPSQGSGDFTGSWAEDSSTPVPIITVVIEASKKAAGQYAVRIIEKVDPRFGVTFEAEADPVAPSVIGVFPYLGNVFGTVRPWVEHPLTPTEMTATTKLLKAAATTKAIKQSKSKSAKKSTSAQLSARNTAAKVAAPAAVKYVFTLGWENVQPVGGLPANPVNLGAGSISKNAPVTGILDRANSLELPAQGVRLCLYDAQVKNQKIASTLRYIRAENMSFTRADVMLTYWDPVH
jgi:hypothetical protein